MSAHTNTRRCLRVLALCALTLPASAQPLMPLVSYQGHLTAQGAPFDGEGRFKFALIDAAGDARWMSAPDANPVDGIPDEALTVPVTRGLFSVLLGDTTIPDMAPIPAEVFEQRELWLRIWFDDGVTGFEPITADERLTTAPYAMLASSALVARAVDEQSVTRAMIAPGAVDGSHLSTPAAPTPGQVLSYEGNALIWNDPVPGDSVFSLAGSSAFYNGGRVGLGTSSPSGGLQVANGGLAVTGFSSPYLGAGRGVFIENSDQYGGHVFAYDYSALSPRALLLNAPGGHVGIGTLAPGAPLEVSATFDQPGTSGVPNVSLTGSKPTLMWTQPGVGTDSLSTTWFWNAQMQDGNLVFSHRTVKTLPSSDTGWLPALQLFRDGSGTRIGGEVTEVRTLRITGGADLSEPFAISEPQASPGSVLVIDTQHPGKLRLSASAYDKKVAGIVSGANGIESGISMTQLDPPVAGRNVALSGRVYVRANVSGGAVEPGDLLTTSDVAGEAMKVTNYTRAQGAVLGKAMGGLASGSGLLLVLVTLQ